MFYRLKNQNELLDWADYKYSEDCLETDIVTQKELEKNPQKIIVQNGELILNPDWDDINLNNAKQAKIAENDTKRDVALNQGVEYKGVLFDSDTDQKVNLMATVEMLPEGTTVVWYGMDNQPLECTKEDLYNIGGLITQLHSFCWNKNAEIKAEINEAQTIEEVDAIVIDYNVEVI